jgi:hypothetical protein
VVSFTPLPLYPRGKSPGTHWIGRWTDLRDGLDDMEKLKYLTSLGLELWPLGQPARSQSLYRLRYREERTVAKMIETLYYMQESRGLVSRWGNWFFFDLPNLSSRIMVKRFTQSLTEMSKSYSRNRPWRLIGLWYVKNPTLSRKSASRWRQGWQPYARPWSTPQKHYFSASGTRVR